MAIPTHQMHLYVMQNTFGLIKIGRSTDAERRLKALESGTNCVLDLVATLQDQGHQEEAVHLKLARHRLSSEWFCGSDKSRRAIARVLGLVKVEWPHDLDAPMARLWLADLAVRQRGTTLRRERVRLICFLKAVECGLANENERHGHWVYDCRIQSELFRESEMDGKMHRWGIRRDQVPPYTSDIETALSLWPEQQRPTSWSAQRLGSTPALSCCIAGLCVLWNIQLDKLKARLN